MLKPNELRYGNNIYSPEGNIITVTFQTFSAMHEVEKGLRPHGFRCIKLDETIFLRLGLEKVPGAYNVPECNYWISSLPKKDGGWKLYQQIEEDGDCCLIRNVYYVNELQNIIFALTDKMPAL